MKKDLAIAMLSLATAVSVLFGLMCLRLYSEDQRRIEKLQHDLTAAELKKDYFEWRESNAIGHTEPAQNFPQWKELEELNTK